MEQVILVDENDVEVGTMEKLEAHKKGLLHRAFSVLIFNSRGELLIQQRAINKYHSPGLWTNTCCSHPRPNESITDAAQRRLKEEMGIDTPLTLSHKFLYRVDFENGLIENEMDYVFSGTFNGVPVINPDEVNDWQFIPIADLKLKMNQSPHQFTHWFKLIMNNWNGVNT